MFIDHLWREAEVAEQAGFDSLVVPERHVRTECLFPSPLLLLAGLATRTTRIRLGTYILILPLYDPVHIAEQMAMIDLMSNGRLICGVASGYHPDYNNAFSIPLRAHSAEWRAPEHRSREAQHAACQSAAGRRSRQPRAAARAESEGP
jgi:alkanesulfonate monooxygenase SsuD/methylene tetrahydromethanopterin reductase-like flavin-dependent oxidoreductase (luciferase family)